MKTVRAEAATDPAVAKTPWRERAGDWLRGSLLRPATVAVAVAILIAGAAGYALREDGGGSPSTEYPGDRQRLRGRRIGPDRVRRRDPARPRDGASRERRRLPSLDRERREFGTPSAAFVPHDDGTALPRFPRPRAMPTR